MRCWPAVLLFCGCARPAPRFDRSDFERTYPELRGHVWTAREYDAALGRPRGCGEGSLVFQRRIEEGDCLRITFGDAAIEIAVPAEGEPNLGFGHLPIRGRTLNEVLSDLETVSCVPVNVELRCWSLPRTLVFGGIEGGCVSFDLDGWEPLSRVISRVKLRKDAALRQVMILRSPSVSPQLGVRAIVCDLEEGEDSDVAPGEAVYVPTQWSIGPGVHHAVMRFLMRSDWDEAEWHGVLQTWFASLE